MPVYRLSELSEALGESFEGDGSTGIKGVAEITSAREGELSFVANPKYVALIPECKASALIVPVDLETAFRPLIRSRNPYLTFTKALSLFHQDRRRTGGGVHPSSHVSEDAKLGKEATVMPNAVIEAGASVGDRTVIYPGAYIGRGCVIGGDVTVYSNVSVYDGCRIGDRCIVHAGCRIGSMAAEAAAPEAEPAAILEEDVELGANVVVAGGWGQPTRVGKGTKIDNLVQVGAGCVIGPHCIIVAQVTLGENVTLGQRVTIAGQVVVSPGLTVGARSRIGAKSVVEEDVPEDSDYWGIPAQPHRDEKRLKANLARLPKMFEKLRNLEEKLSRDK